MQVCTVCVVYCTCHDGFVDLVKLRLAYAQRNNEPASKTKSKTKPISIPYSNRHGSDSSDDETRLSKSPILNTAMHSPRSSDSRLSQSQQMQRIDMTTLDGMQIADVVAMLNETEVLEEQASIVHYLWMKR